MQTALSVSQIENSLTPEAPRIGDGSFEKELEKAKSNLDPQKQAVVQAALNQINALLTMFSQNLDFSKSLNDVEKIEAPAKTEDIKPQAANNKEERKNNASQASEDKRIDIKDVKVLKEVLNKFIPNPIVIVPATFSLNSAETKSVSKTDIQIMIDQIVENARLLKTQKKVELSLMLNETEFGKIDLSLSSYNGMISIQIAASAETKKSLDSSLDDLKNALESANVKFDQIKITEVKYDGLHTAS